MSTLTVIEDLACILVISHFSVASGGDDNRDDDDDDDGDGDDEYLLDETLTNIPLQRVHDIPDS